MQPPAPPTPPPAPSLETEPDASAAAPRFGWEALEQLDWRVWVALGVISSGAVAIGGAMGMGLHRAPLVPAVLIAAMAVAAARVGWGWLRGGSRRARMRDGVLSRVEEYGGGVYGTGAALTLLVLSVRSMQTEWVEANGLGEFLRGMSLEFWIGFSGESIANAVQAGMWPVHWYARHGIVAALAVTAVAWAGDAVADAWRRRAGVEAEGEGGTVSPVRAVGAGAE